MITERAQRMLDSAPTYYDISAIYAQIQQAVADELDLLVVKKAEAKAQLRITTATWGLQFWEEKLSIPTLVADSYDIRRSRVLSKWRGVGNFSGALLKKVAESYAGAEVNVTIDIPTGQITITFAGKHGIPPNMADLQAAIENIVHAHLGVTYVITYLTWGELDVAGKTWNDLGMYTWDALELAKFV